MPWNKPLGTLGGMEITETEALLGQARAIAERQMGERPDTDLVLAVFRRLCFERDMAPPAEPDERVPDGETVH